MKNNTLSLSMLAFGAITILGGCVDAGETLRILNNEVPGQGCIAGNGTDFFTTGQIDVNADRGYIFTPIVENRAVGTKDNDRTAFIDAAIVNLTFADGFYDLTNTNRLRDTGLSFFTQPLSGSIVQGATSFLSFEILPKAVLDEIAAKLSDGETTRVIASIEMRGTIDGSTVKSPSYSYPIEVCNNCMRNLIGDCSAIGQSTTVQLGGACQELQDGILDCCKDAGGALICPASGPAL